MVMCGVGLYIPYVAFHTTVFERLIAASRHPCNLGFLMYLADTIGYLGYFLVLALKGRLQEPGMALTFFHGSLIVTAVFSIICLAMAMIYFRGVLKQTDLT